MTTNYRVFKYSQLTPGIDRFGIHWVRYDENGKIISWSHTRAEPYADGWAYKRGESGANGKVNDLALELNKMLVAIRLPMLETYFDEANVEKIREIK